MKKTRIFIPGSWKERKYIAKMNAKGWMLTNVKGLCYYFQSQNTLNSADAENLSIDFLATPLTSEEKKALTQESEHFVERKIPFYQNTVIYLYGTHSLNTIELSEQTKIELDFLNRLANHVLTFKNIMIIIFMLVWTLLLTLYETTKISIPFFMVQLPLITLFIIWILSIITRYQTKKRIAFLEKQSGVFNEDWAPTRTIILRNLSQKPDIDAFSFLGKWRFITANKKGNTFYYQLQSHYSEDDIKATIMEELGVKEHQITVVSQLGLFPIGWFGFS
ncbi:hypothetical protein P7H33_02905 [Vagococcus lutrae]|uniref:hypothetical protein n=1 Tax=Vagococcus lutrae TaxID=81947 RepID=UPI00288EEBDC|nr:hypothetical protein [Vagococcus lutrae]MDT2811892.1 hypothetical protein [Vagococcus lutrae]